jgi:ABC-type glycerol-3-phosphate transport system substrate-binding protein
MPERSGAASPNTAGREKELITMPVTVKINRRRIMQVAGATTAAMALPPGVGAAGWRLGSPPAVIVRQADDTAWDEMWQRAAEPYAGATVRVPAGVVEGHFGASAEAAATFAELTGIESDWESIPIEQQYQKIFLDLTSQSGTYDLIPLNYAWFGAFQSGNHLEPVEQYLNDERFPSVDMGVFIPRLVEVYTMYEGAQYGLPWLGDAMIFPYNRAHFEEVELDPNAPPTTWDQVIEFGERLTTGDRYGFALMGGSPGPSHVHLRRDPIRPRTSSSTTLLGGPSSPRRRESRRCRSWRTSCRSRRRRPPPGTSSPPPRRSPKGSARRRSSGRASSEP